MLAHWVLFLGFLIFSLKYLIKPFKEIKAIFWIILLLVFLTGFYLNNSQYWFNHHTDGYVSEESAHFWLKTGKFVKSCALGNVDDCKFYHDVLFLPGHPFLIALTDLISGHKSIHGPMVSGILSSFTAIVLFLLIYALFKSEIFGLLAALIFIFIPFGIMESRSPMPRPTSLLFIALTLLFFLIALKHKKWRLWILTVLTLSFAIYVRQENYILLPFLAVFFLIFNWPKIWATIKENAPIFLICFAAFFLFQIPALQWLIFDNPFQGYQADKGHFGIFAGNILILAPEIFKHFFNQSFGMPRESYGHYNIYISYLFLLGFIAACFLLILEKESRRGYLFILSLFLLYFFFTAAIAPAMEIRDGRLWTGDYIRRTLPLNFPYAILAAFPLYLAVGLVGRLVPRFKGIFLGLIFAALFLFLAISLPIPLGLSLFKDARAEYGYSINYYKAVSRTPSGCHVATGHHLIPVSDYFPENRRKVIDLNLIFSGTEKLFLEEMRKAGCIVYFEDYFCHRCQFYQSCFACDFLEKYFDKKFIFREGQIAAFELYSE